MAYQLRSNNKVLQPWVDFGLVKSIFPLATLRSLLPTPHFTLQEPTFQPICGSSLDSKALWLAIQHLLQGSCVVDVNVHNMFQMYKMQYLRVEKKTGSVDRSENSNKGVRYANSVSYLQCQLRLAGCKTRYLNQIFGNWYRDIRPNTEYCIKTEY